LIYLLFRRFEIVKQVWEVKKQAWINNPYDEARWKKLMDENLEVSRDFWLNDSLIIDLWDRIHKEALDLEK
jgi:chorismate mutase